MLASTVLVALPDGKLEGMAQVAWGALFVACLVPVGASILERKVKAREALVPAPVPSALVAASAALPPLPPPPPAP
jgi:hypothetical protein